MARTEAADGGTTGWIGRRRWLILALLVVVGLAGTVFVLSSRGKGERRWEIYEQGVKAFEAGTYGVAAKIFESYLEKYGEHAASRYMAGLSWWQLGEKEKGFRLIVQAAKADPDLDEATLFLAERTFAQAEPEHALRYAMMALENAPRPPEAHLIAGHVLALSSHADLLGAISHLERAWEGGAAGRDSLLLLLELYRKARDAFPSEDLARKWNRLERTVDELLLSEVGRDAGSHDYQQLTRFRLARGDYEGAREALANCRRLGDTGADYWFLRLRLDWLSGRRDGIAAVVGEWRRSGPNVFGFLETTDFLRRIGRADLVAELAVAFEETFREELPFRIWRIDWLRRSGREEDALAAIEDALEDFPGESRLLRLRAGILDDAGKREEGLAVLRSLFEEDPGDVRTRLLLADLLIRGADPGALATRDLARARELLDGTPDLPEGRIRAWPLYLRARISFLEGDLENALRSVRAAVRADPLSIRSRRLNAELCRRRGEHEAAVEEWSAILNLEGSDPAILIERAKDRLAGSPGRSAAARADCEEALRLDPGRRDGYIVLAAAHLRASPPDVEKAEAVLEEAAGRFEDAVEPVLMLATLDLRRGQREEALSRLDEALRRADTEEERLDVFEARLRVESSEGERAEEGIARRIGEVFAEERTRMSARVRAGWVLFEAGDRELARSWAERALAEDPGSSAAARLLFETLLAEEETLEESLPRAQKIVRELRDRAPDAADLAYMEGRLALLDQDAEAARSALSRAHVAAPDDAYVSCYFGQALMETEALGEAERVLREAVSLRPDLLTARLILAETLYRRGLRALGPGAGTEPVRLFDEASRLDPEHESASFGYVASSIAARLPWNEVGRAAAIERCEALVSRLREEVDGPEHPKAPLLSRCLLARAQLAMLDRDWRGAAGAIREFLSLHPEDEWAETSLGLALLNAGRPEEAVEHYLGLLERGKRGPRVRLLLGEALARAERWEEAEELFRGWLEEDAGSEPALVSLAWVLRETDREGAAAELLLDALEAGRGGVEAGRALLRLPLDPAECARAAGALRAAKPEAPDAGDLLYLVGEFSARGGEGSPVETWSRAWNLGFERDDLRFACLSGLLTRHLDEGELKSALALAREMNALVGDELSIDPSSPHAAQWSRAACLSGVAFYRASDLVRAERLFRRSLEIRPGYPLAANNLACALLEQAPSGGLVERAAFEEAEALARMALERDPGNPTYLDSLAAVLLARRKPKEATEVLDEIAAALAPLDPSRAPVVAARATLWVRRAEVARQSGDAAGARAALEKAREIRPEVTGESAYRRVAGMLEE